MHNNEKEDTGGKRLKRLGLYKLFTCRGKGLVVRRITKKYVPTILGEATWNLTFFRKVESNADHLPPHIPNFYLW